MDSTLICTATPATTCAPAVVDALVLPAATEAPAALVIAVEDWLSQETSVLSTVVLGTGVLGTTDVAGHGYAGSAANASSAKTAVLAAPAMSFRTRNDVQGSPPRGAPV